MNNKSLPKYDSPPVIETVLSAQFAQLPKFTNAHAGWYWKNYLDPAWDQVITVLRIEDRFEQFGGEKRWTQEEKISILAGPQTDRLQIVRSDNRRMIQIQNTRFVYNWRKPDRGGEYPSYERLLPEFKENYLKFEQFTKDSGCSEIKLNQWEVTYVNYLPKGDLWNTANDWLGIFPKFGVLAANVPGQVFDNFRGFWTFIINEDKGRIHVEMKHVRVGGDSDSEVLLVQLTARGPVNDEIDLYSGFDIGHEAIVRTFTEITSTNCHKLWKRRV